MGREEEGEGDEVSEGEVEHSGKETFVSGFSSRVEIWGAGEGIHAGLVTSSAGDGLNFLTPRRKVCLKVLPSSTCGAQEGRESELELR
eukprot:3283835-Rhodomonas_salina.1